MKCNKLIICGFTKIYLLVYRFYIRELIATCTSIEIDSLMNLVQHLQNICAQTSVTYEIKICKATVEALFIHYMFKTKI